MNPKTRKPPEPPRPAQMRRPQPKPASPSARPSARPSAQPARPAPPAAAQLKKVGPPNIPTIARPNRPSNLPAPPPKISRPLPSAPAKVPSVPARVQSVQPKAAQSLNTVQAKPRKGVQSIRGGSASLQVTISSGVNSASGSVDLNNGAATSRRTGTSGWRGWVDPWIWNIANGRNWGNFNVRNHTHDAEIEVLMQLNADLNAMALPAVGPGGTRGTLNLQSTLAICRLCRACINSFASYWSLAKNVQSG